jgi:hypothetical protein
MLDESRWPYGDAWAGTAARDEVDRARFLLWWLTARPDEEVPARFRRRNTAEPTAAEHGSVTVTLREGYGRWPREPFC